MEKIQWFEALIERQTFQAMNVAHVRPAHPLHAMGFLVLSWAAGMAFLGPHAVFDATHLPQVVGYSIIYAVFAVLGVRVQRLIYTGFEAAILFIIAFTIGPIGMTYVAIGGNLLAGLLRLLIGPSIGWKPYPIGTRIRLTLLNVFLSASSVTWAMVVYLFVLGGAFMLRDLSLESALQVTVAVLTHAALSNVFSLLLGYIQSGRDSLFPEVNRAVTTLRLIGLEMLSTPFVLLLPYFYNWGRVREFFALFVIFLLMALAMRIALQRQWQIIQRVQQLDAVNQIGQRLAKVLSVQDAANIAYEHLANLIQMPIFYLATYDATTHQLAFPFVMVDGQRQTWPPKSVVRGVHARHLKGEPLLISGRKAALAYQDMADQADQPSTYSGGVYMGVPLVSEDQVKGWLVAQHPTQSDAYDRGTFTVFSAVASQIAAVQHNANLYNDLYTIADRLVMLNNVAALVTTVPNPRQLLDLIAKIGLDFSGANHSAVYTLEENQHTLHLQSGVHLSDAYWAAFNTIPFGDPKSDFIDTDPITTPAALFIRGEVLALTSFSAPPGPKWQPFADALQAKSLLAIPLTHELNPVGMLLVFYDSVPTFRTAELHLIETLANQLAASIGNARLIDDLRVRADDLAYLAQSSRAFSSTLDLPSVANYLFDELNRLVQPSWITLRLLESDGGLQLVKEVGHDQRLEPKIYPQGTLAVALESRRITIGPIGERDRQMMDEIGTATMVAVPLVRNDRAFGVVVIGHEQPFDYPPRLRQLLEAIVNQAALALSNAEVFQLVDQALGERVSELSAIEKISRKISASLDLREIIREVVNVAVQTTNADVGGVPLVPPFNIYQGQPIERILYRDGTEMVAASRPQDFTGIVGKVIQTGQPVRLGDVRNHPDFTNLTHLDIRSELCVPVVHNGRCIGAINVESTRLDAFNETHERFLRNLADHVAVAVQNVRLYTEARTRSDQLGVVFDSVREGLMLLESDGRIVLANPAAAYLLNLSLEAVLNKCLDEVEEARAWSEPILAALASTTTAPSTRLYHLDNERGSRDISETMLPLLDEEGKLSGLLLVLRDVSQEEAAKQFQREVADMLVHDLRSPIASVISSLNLIKEQIAAGEYADLDELVNIALASGQRQLKLIESLLDIAKLEKGQMLLDLTSVSAYTLAQNVVSTLEPQARDAQISLRNLIAPELPRLMVDESLVSRVFTNLVDNAIRHTPSNGHVRLEATHDHTLPTLLRISVTDTGKGVPPDQRERVFEKFAQIPKSPVRGHRGSGLGLTLCKLVVEAHGGKIWIESGPEGGAAFIFTLPIAEEGSLPHERQPADR